MTLRQMIKSDARRALKGSWIKAFCLVLLSLGVSTLFSTLEELFVLMTNTTNYWSILTAVQVTPQMIRSLLEGPLLISLILIILSIFVSAPLNLGFTRWYYQRTDGEYGPVGDVFYYFSGARLLWRSISFTVQCLVRALFWGVLFFTPVLVVTGLSLYSLRAASDRLDILLGSVGILTAFALLLLTVVCYHVFIQRYALGAYYLAADDRLSAFRAISKSVKATHGHKGELFLFELSFIGWKLLNIIILPQLYTVPYLSQSRALYARFLMETYARRTGEPVVSASSAKEAAREFTAPAGPETPPLSNEA